MKSWIKPVVYLGVALCLMNVTRDDSSKNQIYRNSNIRYKESIKKLWDADTLVKDSNKDTHKSLYELMLPDSVLHKNSEGLDSMKLQLPLESENEMLDLRIAAAQEYDKFFYTKNREYALKAIAYLQYAAIRFPGDDGSGLERSARLIDGISKELRKYDKNY
jgi:hypothetical protein